MSLGIIEQLTHSTVRIETTLTNGQISSGTGFLMNFLQSNEHAFPVIITNKHVISNSAEGRFHFTLAKADGSPDIGNHKQFTYDNFESRWIKHSDPTVDLAAFLLAPLLNSSADAGSRLFYIPLQTNLIPSNTDRSEFSTMEDVIMIGYPSGIWDTVNNLPIIRKGITGTHCGTNWNGKTEFLTDIASFPGSSGSPVLIANRGSYINKLGTTVMGSNRIRLLGVHYAGFMHTASGEIKIVTAPTSNTPIALTNIPNNLGLAINSTRILELETTVAATIGKRWPIS
ncbi:trypsin-like peptidase domain-containing protein [Pseudomonas yamanorum]|uniref:trypsin-like peptidase domain-containing protein n=1 Tax=Pseudomonas yamanorum TaxID=515393 RepID=UPI003BA26AA1